MFESIEDAKKQILRDKHTLLEGYVTEYFFEQQFLKEKVQKYTNGWWFALRGDTRFFFLVKEKMNNVDKKVFNLLKSQYECWVAYPKDDKWFFNDGTVEYDEIAFLKRFSIIALRNKLSATSNTKNTIRQNQCVNFFVENNVINKIAIERNFADDFLTVYFNSMVNIDYITENTVGRLCVIEVKFKYEDRAGNFGINAGQVLMFRILEDMGFEIHHMILYNHMKDKDLSIFGFLKLDSSKRFWLYGKLTGFLDRKRSIAIKETSVDGKSEQAYYPFGKKEISYKILFKQ